MINLKVDSEIKLLKKRIKDLNNLLESEKVDFRENKSLLSRLLIDREKMRNSIDEALQEHISPYLTQRDELIKQESSYLEKEKTNSKSIKN